MKIAQNNSYAICKNKIQTGLDLPADSGLNPQFRYRQQLIFTPKIRKILQLD